MATIDAEAAGRAIVFVSASKAWNLPGLKAALAVAGGADGWAALSRLPIEVTFGTGLLGRHRRRGRVPRRRALARRAARRSGRQPHAARHAARRAPARGRLRAAATRPTWPGWTCGARRSATTRPRCCSSAAGWRCHRARRSVTLGPWPRPAQLRHVAGAPRPRRYAGWPLPSLRQRSAVHDDLGRASTRHTTRTLSGRLSAERHAVVAAATAPRSAPARRPRVMRHDAAAPRSSGTDRRGRRRTGSPAGRAPCCAVLRRPTDRREDDVITVALGPDHARLRTDPSGLTVVSTTNVFASSSRLTNSGRAAPNLATSTLTRAEYTVGSPSP